MAQAETCPIPASLSSADTPDRDRPPTVGEMLDEYLRSSAAPRRAAGGEEGEPAGAAAFALHCASLLATATGLAAAALLLPLP